MDHEKNQPSNSKVTNGTKVLSIRNQRVNRNNTIATKKYALTALVIGVVMIYILNRPRSFDAITGSTDEITALSKKLDEITKKYNVLTKKYNELLKAHAAVPAVDARKSFKDILLESGSDKYDRHHYEHYYIPWLTPFRDVSKLKLLEIGADEGHSLLAWSNYFTDPELILGLAYGDAARDIDKNVAANRESGEIRDAVQVVKGDQFKEETMETLRTMGPYHIIVDDGSHVPDHMAFSLFSLWNSVEPGGLYIVEDLETNYWPPGSVIYNYTLNGTGVGTSPKDNLVEKMKQLIDTLVKNQIGASMEVMSIMPGDETICSIEFGKNLVALKKCTAAEMANAPLLQYGVGYDIDHMDAWVRNAKSTNPDGFNNYIFYKK